MARWEEIYCTDAERDQTFAESAEIYENLKARYARWQYRIVEVPQAGVDQRVRFILRTVNSALATSP